MTTKGTEESWLPCCLAAAQPLRDVQVYIVRMWAEKGHCPWELKKLSGTDLQHRTGVDSALKALVATLVSSSKH